MWTLEERRHAETLEKELSRLNGNVERLTAALEALTSQANKLNEHGQSVAESLNVVAWEIDRRDKDRKEFAHYE